MQNRFHIKESSRFPRDFLIKVYYTLEWVSGYSSLLGDEAFSIEE